MVEIINHLLTVPLMVISLSTEVDCLIVIFDSSVRVADDELVDTKSTWLTKIDCHLERRERYADDKSSSKEQLKQPENYTDSESRY